LLDQTPRCHQWEAGAQQQKMEDRAAASAAAKAVQIHRHVRTQRRVQFAEDRAGLLATWGALVGKAVVDQAHIHGAGSTAPVAVAQGHGKPSYKTAILSTEWDAIVDIASTAGIPVMGQGGLLFDIVQTTTVDGLPKRTAKIESCPHRIEEQTFTFVVVRE
jgi:hypothetical protein